MNSKRNAHLLSLLKKQLEELSTSILTTLNEDTFNKTSLTQNKQNVNNK